MNSPRVAVIGGGISGLAAALAVCSHRPDAVVTVYESASVVGGKLRVAELAGQPHDVGAEALLTRRPEGLQLIDALGLSAERLDPLTTAAMVRAGGALHPLPQRTMFGIPGDPATLDGGLLGTAARERVAHEPDADPLPPLADDVAVGALVRARLGDDVFDRLVDPLLGGVYAGRADQLSLRATMPLLAARLADGGSLVRAAAAATGPAVPRPAPAFTSLTGGLGRLASAVADAAPFAIETGTTVRAVSRTATGFRLEIGPVPAARAIDVDAVVVATPAPKAARLLREIAPVAAAELAGIETASLAIVSVALRDVHLPAGSGVLVAAGEPLTVKAVTVSSQKWPSSPDGLTRLRASVGRLGDEHVLQRDDAELIEVVRRDLRALYGSTAKPVDAIVTRWGGGLPQYAVGHVERIARVRAAAAVVPGLGVCGAAFDGVGVPACIASAYAAAGTVLAALAT